MAGRSKNGESTRNLQSRVPAGVYRRLEQLADSTEYGNKPGEVARYLIMREIDDMIRAGVFDRLEKKKD